MRRISEEFFKDRYAQIKQVLDSFGITVCAIKLPGEMEFGKRVAIYLEFVPKSDDKIWFHLETALEGLGIRDSKFSLSNTIICGQMLSIPQGAINFFDLNPNPEKAPVSASRPSTPVGSKQSMFPQQHQETPTKKLPEHADEPMSFYDGSTLSAPSFAGGTSNNGKATATATAGPPCRKSLNF